VFYVQDRVARWIGSNSRKTAPIGDLFAPLASRSFVEAAFQLSAYERFTEPLHHGLLALLAPQLHRLRFAQGPWRSQIPAWELARWAARQPLRVGARAVGLRRNRPTARAAFSQAAWLHNRRHAVRDLARQHPSSEIWRYIDRSRFEHLTSDEVAADDLVSAAEGLYLATTLLEYASAC